MEDIFVYGDLHLAGGCDIPLSELHKDGITIYVKGDVYFHSIDDEFIYKKEDMCIENAFEKYPIRDIIAYSTHEKLEK